MSNLGGKNVSEDTDKSTAVTGIVAGDNINNIDASDPANPIINADTQAGGQVDSVVGGTNCSVDATDPVNPIVNADTQNNAKVTTKGDLEGFSSVAARIPVGTNDQVLTADSTAALGVAWKAAAAGGAVATDVIWDAKGDLAGGTGADTAVKLTVGTNGQLLSADSGEATGLKWIAAPSGDPLTTKGDIMGYDTDADRIPVGTNDQVLTADSTNAFGVAWKTAAGGGGSATVAQGAKVTVTTPITSIGAGSANVVWETEEYDDNGFIDIAGAPTELTVPAGVTRVNVYGYVDASSEGTNDFNLTINRFNSSDVFQETVARSYPQTDNLLVAATICALGVECSATDYFVIRYNTTDGNWNITAAQASIQDATVGTQSTVLTTKGDLFTYDTVNARLAVGTNDQVLTADSGEATGVKWAAPAAAAPQGAVATKGTPSAGLNGSYVVAWDTQDYDDNDYLDIGADNDRFTIPSGTTRVNLSVFVTCTGIDAAEDRGMAIYRYNSSDVFQEAVAQTFARYATSTNNVRLTVSALGVTCATGDYFVTQMIMTDVSWTASGGRFAIADVTP